MNGECLLRRHNLPRPARRRILEHERNALDPEEFPGNSAHSPHCKLCREEERLFRPGREARSMGNVEIENVNPLQRFYLAVEPEMHTADHGLILRIQECPPRDGQRDSSEEKLPT